VESYRWVIRHRGLALKERVERPLKKSLSLGLLGHQFSPGIYVGS
jgi:hypothetical protein